MNNLLPDRKLREFASQPISTLDKVGDSRYSIIVINFSTITIAIHSGNKNCI